MIPLPDSSFGRFLLLDQIAVSSRGALYRAQERGSDRLVALKIFDLTANDDVARVHLARFYRDVETASGLSHPNLVRIYGFGEADGHPYVSMELCEGPVLAPLLRRSERPPFERAVTLIAEVARALDLAHHQDLLHRNLKPTNLIFHDGVLKIIDFGTIHIEEAQPMSSEGAVDALKYRAPEQLRGTQLDGRTDEHALGILFYQLVTGVYPFPGKGSTSSSRIGRERPSPPRWWNPSLPMEVDSICARVLSREPSERYPNCLAFAHALEHMLSRQKRPGQFIPPPDPIELKDSPVQLEVMGLERLAPPEPPRAESPGPLLPLQQRPRTGTSPAPALWTSPAADAVGFTMEAPDADDEARDVALVARSVAVEKLSLARSQKTAGRETSASSPPGPNTPFDAPPPVEGLPAVAAQPEAAPLPVSEVPAWKNRQPSQRRRPVIDLPPPVEDWALQPGDARDPDELEAGLEPPPLAVRPISAAPSFSQDPELAALIAANQQGTPPRLLLETGAPPPKSSLLRRIAFVALSAAAAAAVLHYYGPDATHGVETAPEAGPSGAPSPASSLSAPGGSREGGDASVRPTQVHPNIVESVTLQPPGDRAEPQPAFPESGELAVPSALPPGTTFGPPAGADAAETRLATPPWSPAQTHGSSPRSERTDAPKPVDPRRQPPADGSLQRSGPASVRAAPQRTTGSATPGTMKQPPPSRRTAWTTSSPKPVPDTSPAAEPSAPVAKGTAAPAPASTPTPPQRGSAASGAPPRPDEPSVVPPQLLASGSSPGPEALTARSDVTGLTLPAPGQGRAPATTPASRVAGPPASTVAAPSGRLELRHYVPGPLFRGEPLVLLVETTTPGQQLHVLWRASGDVFRRLEMTPDLPKRYRAVLEPGADVVRIQYYFEATDSSGHRSYLRRDIPYEVTVEDKQGKATKSERRRSPAF